MVDATVALAIPVTFALEPLAQPDKAAQTPTHSSSVPMQPVLFHSAQSVKYGTPPSTPVQHALLDNF